VAARLLVVGFLSIVRVLRIGLLIGPCLVGSRLTLPVCGRSIVLNARRRTSVLNYHFALLIAGFARLRLALTSCITVLRRCVGRLGLAIRLRVRLSPTVRIGLVASTVPQALICGVGARLL